MNPAFPLKLDYDISGPAAGYYAAQQLGAYDEALGRSNQLTDLDIAQKQINVDEATANLPLKAAQRANLLETEAATSRMQPEIQAEKLAKLQAGKSEAELKQMNDRAAFMYQISQDLPDPNDTSPAAKAKYAAHAEQGRKLGINMAPDWGQDAYRDVVGKAKMAEGYIKAEAAKATAKALADAAMERTKVTAAGTVEAARTAQGAKEAMQPDTTRLIQKARAAVDAGTPLTPADAAAVAQALKADNAKDKDQLTADREKTASLKETYTKAKARDKKNDPTWTSAVAKVGLTVDADPAMVAVKTMEEEVADRQTREFVTTFAKGKIAMPDGSTKPVTDPEIKQMLKQFYKSGPTSAQTAPTAAPASSGKSLYNLRGGTAMLTPEQALKYGATPVTGGAPPAPARPVAPPAAVAAPLDPAVARRQINEAADLERRQRAPTPGATELPPGA